MSYLDRKPDKSKPSNKVEEVINAYTNDEEALKYDPLGMYTGRPVDSEAINAIKNGYKIYMRIDDPRRPQQDADDL